VPSRFSNSKGCSLLPSSPTKVNRHFLPNYWGLCQRGLVLGWSSFNSTPSAAHGKTPTSRRQKLGL
jgi:hypothetical protein